MDDCVNNDASSAVDPSEDTALTAVPATAPAADVVDQNGADPDAGGDADSGDDDEDEDDGGEID